MRPLKGIILGFVLFIVVIIILMPLYEDIVAPEILFDPDILPIIILCAIGIMGGCILYYQIVKPKK